MASRRRGRAPCSDRGRPWPLRRGDVDPLREREGAGGSADASRPGPMDRRPAFGSCMWRRSQRDHPVHDRNDICRSEHPSLGARRESGALALVLGGSLRASVLVLSVTFDIRAVALHARDTVGPVDFRSAHQGFEHCSNWLEKRIEIRMLQAFCLPRPATAPAAGIRVRPNGLRLQAACPRLQQETVRFSSDLHGERPG